MSDEHTTDDSNEHDPGGRPEHEPTDQNRKTVEAMGMWATQADMASVLGIDEKTLRKHYRDELDKAKVKADSMVVQSHFQKCVGRPAKFDEKGKCIQEEIKPDTTAIIWWEKARMGWKETSKHEHSGEDGGAIPLRLDSLTDAQLAQLADRLETAITSRLGSG